ncbi:MAG: LuxR family transcriptional regulator, partial [Prosthecobacter sp.]|uniref:AAA family ATPase n=1 Tax=Prosthecobacter sp. TaxID=1965333 RepID=UPI0019FB75CE|nr:LuxR family transcriptional regulator [Prosthecobacter sp.]
MPAPILATKLYLPPPRPNAVPRPRLLARLNDGLRAGRKLALISAPAGFGKTTLVSEWIATLTPSTAGTALAPTASPTRRGEIAWLSLDEGDSDLAQFLVYFVAALQTIAPQFGEGILAALHAQPPTAALLTSLLNEMATIPDRVIFVFDDYHTLDCKPIDEALTFLIDHLPAQMQLIITTREDPQLPLARLRARGQLTELRAADLRFTADEAAEFLNHAMGLSLSPDNIAALET